ncbi:MAG TPA: DUF6191 domain-containing protein [Propionicimonas sp.]|uniref:DUF6191 domain-containing protein n=1 Tax=Propionicimonas sp. TaxID=1955623 RepID=UPI002F4008DE
MSDFFEIFNPGQRYTRQQLETEKLLVVQDAQGGSGPDPLDLDSGSVVLRMPPPFPDADDTVVAADVADAGDVEDAGDG